MKKDFLALDNQTTLIETRHTTRKKPTDLLFVMGINRKSHEAGKVKWKKSFGEVVSHQTHMMR